MLQVLCEVFLAPARHICNVDRAVFIEILRFPLDLITCNPGLVDYD